ncbi:MAG: uracil-DNA glycosylase [Bacteroidales bacterium]
MNPKIDNSWLNTLKNEFNSDYFIELKNFLIEEKKNYIIYPPGNKIFAAYDNTPFDKVKVVIIGQDPYHNPNQAHGMCFSVNKGVAIPPSLQNIFKELHNDIGCKIPDHGNLTEWAKEGVLLLNAILTVRQFVAGSHRNKGWEKFTDATIKILSENKKNLVFILWGNYAKEKKHLIDSSKHLILTAAHPSPLSANKGGFFGCKHFSKTNEYLIEHNIEPINWEIT